MSSSSSSRPILGALRLAVLDMAGTTVEVADAVPVALTAAFARFDMELPAEAIAGVRGRSKREAVLELVRRLHPEHAVAGETADAVLRAFRDALRRQHAGRARAVPGAAETMQWLRARGVAVALATGFDRDLASELVSALGWGPETVSVLVTDDDVQRGRPEPDLILRAMHMTGVTDPAAVLVAGDTSADLIAGARAGAGIVVGVLSGAHDRARLESHTSTVLLASIAELPAWLHSLAA